MTAPAYPQANTARFQRLALAWLTLASLLALLVAVPLVAGAAFETIDPAWYVLLLGPAFGWIAYFRGRLTSVFLLGLPAVGLGLIFLASNLPAFLRAAL